MTDQENRQSLETLPKAHTSHNWRRYLFWAVPVAAAAIAGWIFYKELFSKGPTVEIFFDNAVGLQAGQSKMKYRGVDIGDVTAVALTDDTKLVKVIVDVEKSADTVARQGSLFWVVKPEIGLNAITGLQTIMAGTYIAVQPGTGKPETRFRGIPQPPATQKEMPGLRVMLLAEKLGSVKQHSPVLYHGMQVGEVHDSSLGPTAQVVRIYLNIDRKYAPLVRMNSKFWNAGGVNVSFGWSGLDISAQSIQTLLGGGIAFATPDSKAEEAYDGAAFRLYDKPEKTWSAWFPAISLPLVQHPGLPAPQNGKKGQRK
jgi:paraquat-inducible protein B